MLLEAIAQYDTTKKEYLVSVRKQILTILAKTHDTRKMLSFLNKCCIIGIEDHHHLIYIGIPNDFVALQVKKFFHDSIQQAIHEIFSESYAYATFIYDDTQPRTTDLVVDLKKFLDLRELTPKEKDDKEQRATKAHPQLDNAIKTSLTDHFGILFEKQFTFDKLIVWAHNQLAYSAAHAVAEQPGSAYNPLFIYGNVWLGKTHLMQAIGNHCIINHSESSVVYLPTTKFIDQVVQAIKQNKLSQLMEKFADVSVIMLDDIQFLANKDKTQEIFHNMFNEFLSHNKQIVLTSDRPPKELTLLEPRLQSRFSLWLVVDIKAPDVETKIAILESKLKAKGEHLAPELLDYIATTITSNVRELEGAINLLMMKKKLYGREITRDDIDETLSTLWYELSWVTSPTSQDSTQNTTPHSQSHNDYHSTPKSSKTQQSMPSRATSFDRLVEHVAQYYDIPLEDLKWDKRTKEISFARQCCMWIAKTHFQRTLERIGTYFAGKNHASVIYSISTFDKIYTSQKKEYDKLFKIRLKL